MENYYTYTLAHQSGKVFYVGRGRDYYWDIHEQKARRGDTCKMTTIIQGIWEQGEQIIKHKVLEGVSEEDAYKYQRDLYAKYSVENPQEMIYPGSYPRPIGHGRNIGVARKAKKYRHSEEAKAKMARSRIGKPYSSERLSRNADRLRTENAQHLNNPKTKAKMAQTKTGVPRTPEAKAAMSIAQKRRQSRLTEEERVALVQPWIEAGQVASKRVTKDTSIELIVEETLRASGVVYEKQKRVSLYQCDFYIPSTNTIIEVNGCWHHRCSVCGWNEHRAEEIRAKDAKKLAYLQSKGYVVNIIWEHDIDGHKVRRPKKKG